MNPSNLGTNIFSEIMKPIKDSDKEFEESMNKRGDGLFKQVSDITDVKEESQFKEISKNQIDRQREIDIRRRLKNNIKVEYGKSLKDCLTIDKISYEKANEYTAKIDELPIYINYLASNNENDQFCGLVAIRKLLTQDKNQYIQEIIDNALVFPLSSALDHKLPEFCFEAIACISAISSGSSDQIKSLTNKGIHKKLVSLCDAQFFEIQEQAISAIGNMANDCALIRDAIINEGALDKLLFYLKTAERKSLVKNVLWAFSNFCKGRPPLGYDKISPVSIYYFSF